MKASIDAGNSRFKIAVPDATGAPKLLTNRAGETFTPSVVYFSEDGSVLVGTKAENAALANPKRAVFNWKRHMGTNKVLYTSDDGKSYTAKDILAILLKNAKEDVEAKTEMVVNEAVITVPANYTDNQKQQTIDAAADAGMMVIALPHEPTAAALGNGLHLKKNCTVLVFDLGGGTFDVSIGRVEGNVCKIIATNGEPHLGGQDFNNRIIEKVLEKFESEHNFRPDPAKHPVFFQDMANRAEQLKVGLSAQRQFQIVLSCDGRLVNMTVTRDQFNSWVNNLVDKCIEKTEQTLKDANMTWSEIDELLPVGGGSAMPIVIERLEKASSKKMSRKCEPHCAAALGGVLAGRIEYERQGKPYILGEFTLPPPGVYVHDVLSRPIGVLVLNDKGKEICYEILGKGLPIPSIQTHVFKLTEPHQTQVILKVLQGDNGTDASKCVVLGHFELKDLPPRPDLIGRVEVTYHLDSSGMLTATARDIVSGKSTELRIEYKNNGNSGTSQKKVA